MEGGGTKKSIDKGIINNGVTKTSYTNSDRLWRYGKAIAHLIQSFLLYLSGILRFGN